MAFVAATLLITRWAARQTRTRGDFYVAHGRITPWQNGLAIAGEYISAGTLLGTTALFFVAGTDAFVYLLGALVALSIMLFVVGGRLRNLGRFTFTDVCALRFEERPIRLVASASTLSILLLMMVGQLVGAGAMVEILFGMPYGVAVAIAGGLIGVYVMSGGMLAATWVQIVKAVLMLLGGTVLAALVLSRFSFSFDELLTAAVVAHPRGSQILEPGGLVRSVGDGLSLGMTLVLGPAGLPHLLMRFFTVEDARAASRSIVYAMLIMAYFYLLLALFGYGAVALLTASEGGTQVGSLPGGDNMAVLHLAQAAGGAMLFGAFAAIVFATVLAVSSALSLAAAATVSHDLYAQVLKRGQQVDERREILISRSAVVVFTLLAILLAILLEEQNVVFMTALGVSIAASANFPALMAAMYWRRATTRGVVAGSLVGLCLSIVLIVLGPTIWVGVLGQPQPIFPYQYPTIVSLPCAALVLVVVSLLDRSAQAARERHAFDRLRMRALTGIDVQADRSHGS